MIVDFKDKHSQSYMGSFEHNRPAKQTAVTYTIECSKDKMIIYRGSGVTYYGVIFGLQISQKSKIGKFSHILDITDISPIH